MKRLAKRVFLSILGPTFWFMWDVAFLVYDLYLFIDGVIHHEPINIVICGGCAIGMAWFAHWEWRRMHKEVR